MNLILPYYDSPNMMRKQLEYFEEYEDYISADELRVIVIDDASPNYPAIGVLRNSNIPIELYRIHENKPWNYEGARNLGFYVADDGWVFQTDIDHVVPVGSMIFLLMKEPSLISNCFYRPDRRLIASNKPCKRHNSSFIMTKQQFWNIGGYNEDFVGWYGGGSSAFRRALNRCLKEVFLNDVYTIHYVDEIKDASVSEWGRKDSPYYYKNNPQMRNKANRLMKNYNAKNPLRFTWERVL